jgi:hypothetical protein
MIIIMIYMRIYIINVLYHTSINACVLNIEMFNFKI